MQGDVEIASYNLTMVLQAQGEVGQIFGQTEGFDQILRDPLRVEGEDGKLALASARDQMVLAFQQLQGNPLQSPITILTDVSGAWPLRPAFAESLSNLVAFFLSQSASVLTYWWNVEGVLRDVDRARVIGDLFDQPRIDRILGGDTEPQWFPPRIDFMSGSTFSDLLTFGLRRDLQTDDSKTLHFVINALFFREIVDAGALEEQGQEFTRNAEGILARLVD